MTGFAITRRQAVGGAAVAGALGAAGVAWHGLFGSGSMAEYNAAVARSRAVMGSNPNFLELIRYATLAPSGHNTQPWRFYLRDDRIAICPDFSRRTPIVDPDDHHLFVSLGCAVENLALAANSAGRTGEATFVPGRGGWIEYQLGTAKPARRTPELFDAIPYRQSTRGLFDERGVAVADLKSLAAASDVDGVDIVLLTDRPAIDRVRDLIMAGNSAQMADPAFVRELKHWLRFNPHEALEKGDGLFSVVSGNIALPTWAGPMAFDAMVTARSENDRYAAQLASSSGIAVFVAEQANPEHWTRVGRAAQRFALQATALGLKCAFVNQPVEVAALRPELAGLISLPGRRPDIVLRVGRGAALPYSARRPTTAALVRWEQHG